MKRVEELQSLNSLSFYLLFRSGFLFFFLYVASQRFLTPVTNKSISLLKEVDSI